MSVCFSNQAASCICGFKKKKKRECFINPGGISVGVVDT